MPKDALAQHPSRVPQQLLNEQLWKKEVVSA